MRKKIINKALLNLIKYHIKEQISFSLYVKNYNNWDNEFPDRLKLQKSFLLNIQETDLKESYINEEGKPVIVAGIDNLVYTKILETWDIVAVGKIGSPQFTILKDFDEDPNIEEISKNTKKRSIKDLNSKKIYRSLEILKKLNPGLLK